MQRLRPLAARGADVPLPPRPGGPILLYRRHGGNFSDESRKAHELAEVEAALRKNLAGWPLDDLVPELDWSVLPRHVAEQRARRVLAGAFEARGLPALAADWRRLADEGPATPFRPQRRQSGRRILLTSFGFADSGGGTIVPRYVAKELAQRGHEVTVFAAGVTPIEGAPAYHVRSESVDGVEVVSVHNRPHGLLDLGHPHRELDDPQIAAAFAGVLDRVQPDVVHLHNLHNLGLSLVDATFSRGIRTVFSTHNYWLGCARNYLFRSDLSLCDGPGDGGRACAAASARATPPATRSAAASCASGSRFASTACSPSPRRCGARSRGSASRRAARRRAAGDAGGWRDLGRARPRSRAGPARRAADGGLRRLGLPAQGPTAARARGAARRARDPRADPR